MSERAHSDRRLDRIRKLMSTPFRDVAVSIEHYSIRNLNYDMFFSSVSFDSLMPTRIRFVLHYTKINYISLCDSLVVTLIMFFFSFVIV